MNKPDDYWQQKISAWLHDPVCKVFDILHHEENAKKIAEALYQSEPDKTLYQAADRIAASLTRAVLPPYNQDPAKDGSISFPDFPIITHPLVRNAQLKFSGLPKDTSHLVEDIIRLVKNDLQLDKTHEELGRAGNKQQKQIEAAENPMTPEQWAEKLFNYLFFALSRRLRITQTGGIGCQWELLPADTRMPDHTLWHHLGMVSALYSSLTMPGKADVSMVVFSITPVQGFISNARKLRDFWTGSVLLSYLSFTGITVVMKMLGPDHILYPSLHNQYLVDEWLKNEFDFAAFLSETDSDLEKLQKAGSSIAAFPNKFVFICNTAAVSDLCKKIEAAVKEEWIRIAGIVRDFLQTTCKAGLLPKSVWNTEIDDYWKCSWAASRLASADDIETVRSLLPANKYEREYGIIEKFRKAVPSVNNVSPNRLYGATHSLVQGVLAAGKMKNIHVQNVQQGEKCPLCGEFEVLHGDLPDQSLSAGDYSQAIDVFWEKIRNVTNSVDSYAQTGEHEKLCAVCAVKRYLPRALRKSDKNELLKLVLANADSFPSTTEMASYSYLEKLCAQGLLQKGTQSYQKLISMLHAAELEDENSNADIAAVKELTEKGVKAHIRLTEKDNYYALLLMDGDRMGDLINGETVSARWQDVIHPELVKRLKDSSSKLDSVFKEKIEAGKMVLDQTRTMNPALHSMISDALNNFARYCVSPAIEDAHGRLIYAGGDDVCAVVPLDTVLEAADTIQTGYTLNFASFTSSGPKKIDELRADTAKAGMLLGTAENISLSAGIVIAHHKTPLREVMRDAHRLLDGTAKGTAGRNALAVSLQKRSGGKRIMYLNWNKKNETCPDIDRFKDFLNIQEAVRQHKISTSLLYRMETLAPELQPLLDDLNQPEIPAETKKIRQNQIIDLLAYEIAHSSVSAKDTCLELAQQLAGLCITTKNQYMPDAAVIAGFMASGE